MYQRTFVHIKLVQINRNKASSFVVSNCGVGFIQLHKGFCLTTNFPNSWYKDRVKVTA